MDGDGDVRVLDRARKMLKEGADAMPVIRYEQTMRMSKTSKADTRAKVGDK